MSGRIFRTGLLSLLVLAVAGVAGAQAIGADEVRAHTEPYVPNSNLTLRAQTDLVEVPVVVRDRKQQAVAGLQQNDFVLYDAGKKQQISLFSTETFTPGSTKASAGAAGPVHPAATDSNTVPRYVAICFDDLNTDPESLIRSKAAARQFVKTSLAPGDRVAVVTTAWPRSTEFTDDVAKMLALIDKVTLNQRISGDAGLQCPPISAFEAYLINNNMDPSVLRAKVSELLACAGRTPRPEDTVKAYAQRIWSRALSNSQDVVRAVEALVEGMASIPGRRMILLTSSGFLSGNLENDEDRLITKALHASVVINALSARGLYTIIPGGDASEARPTGRSSGRGAAAQIVDVQSQTRQEQAKDDGMAVLAAGTGGSFFHNSNDLLQGFRQLGMAPDVMYVLGFTPSEAVADGRYHTIKVQVPSGNHYSIRARMGYTAPAKTAPAATGGSSMMDSEMAATDTRADLPVTMAWEAEPQKHGVTCTAQIDVSRLKLATQDGRRRTKLTMVATLRDAAGNFIAGKRSEVEFALTDGSYAKLASTGGIRFSLTLEVPAGAYVGRGLVVDSIDGKMATSNGDVKLQ